MILLRLKLINNKKKYIFSNICIKIDKKGQTVLGKRKWTKLGEKGKSLRENEKRTGFFNTVKIKTIDFMHDRILKCYLNYSNTRITQIT